MFSCCVWFPSLRGWNKSQRWSLTYSPEFTVKLPFLSSFVQRNTGFNCLVCDITRILQTILNFNNNLWQYLSRLTDRRLFRRECVLGQVRPLYLCKYNQQISQNIIRMKLNYLLVCLILQEMQTDPI